MFLKRRIHRSAQLIAVALALLLPDVGGTGNLGGYSEGKGKTVFFGARTGRPGEHTSSPERVSDTSVKKACNADSDRLLDTATFRIRHLPSDRRVLVRIIPRRHSAQRPKRFSASLRDADSGLVLDTVESTASQLARNPDLFLKTESLPAGRYEVALKVRGLEACSAINERVRRFVHNKFVWEENSLGMTDDVIPPFTALEVDGRTVRSVLREHEMGDLGLWDQIVSRGERLLAAPMYWEISVDGERVTPRPVQTPLIRRESPARVSSISRWRSGDLKASMKSEFDMDGFMMNELSLSADRSVSIDKLDLVIPIRSSQARLMNAVSDGTRHHTLGATPAGTGRIWDATQTPSHHLPAGFVSYVWLGTELRGLSWLAESMRGGWNDPNAPAQEIRRRNGAVELIVHFATRRGQLDEPREIQFALQATPVKPRQLGGPNWRLWQPTCTSTEPFYRLCPLGAGLYWGAESPYGHVYPRGRDESVLDTIARARRGAPVGAGVVEQWLLRNEVPEPERERARASLSYTLGMANKQPDAMVAYVNPHDVAVTPEFRVYVDEWRRVPFADRRGGDGSNLIEIDTTPSRSFRDFFLWHLEKLLDSGAIDGFFFDNAYPAATFDPLLTRAWVDEEGDVHPATDWLSMRKLLKRAQVLVHQKRGVWLNLGHMTSAPIAAVQGWTGISLSGEWQYGTKDFQERFDRDLLRAEAIGSQAGTVPVVLPGISGQVSSKRKKELERSLAGVAAVHEIRVMARFEGPLADLWKALERGGYGSESCRVRPYWEGWNGISLRGPDAETLVVQCPDALRILIVSYGPSGTVEVSIDDSLWQDTGSIQCADVETDPSRPLPSEGRSCRIELPRHDFRVVSVEPHTRAAR